MASGTNIRTFFEGKWHEGNIPVMRAADHGSWLGSTVFDGARYFDGLAPDLALHCARVNRSAEAMLMTPTHAAQDIEGIVRDGLKFYRPDQALYIRPMYWGLEDDGYGLGPHRDYTGFAVCLEEIPMSAPDNSVTLTTTSFRRPVLADNVCNAKAGCPCRRCDWQCGRKCHRQCVHREGWCGLHPHRQWHVPRRDHPVAPHCQPARRWG
jgi:branched-chain amino acid aminotransferase